MIDLIRKIFNRKGVDNAIYLCVFILTIFGIVMIGSAAVGQTATKGPTFATITMLKQAFFVAIGYGLMFFFARFFKKKWITYSSSWVLYAICIPFLLVCLLWSDTKGAHAWIKIAGLTIQPSEFVKILMILFLSFHFGQLEEMCIIPRNISKKQKEELQLRKARFCIGRPIVLSGAIFLIIGFLQKDLGSALIFAFICMIMFFVSPRPYYNKYKKLFLILLVIGFVLVVFGAVFILKDYQLGRIYTWLDPLSDPMEGGWQLVNGLIAYSYGGLFGKGFGSSIQKYGYIPESHNDFITAIIYEELGLLGFFLFLIPYCYIIYKMFTYGNKVKDTKSKLILYGIGAYFFAHLLVNVGGVTGFIPMTGVPLLLVSSGGSSTWAAMIAIGIAQSIIGKYNRDRLKEQI